MPENSKKIEFYFDEPRFRMTVAGRFIVRFATYILYAFVLVACVVFLLSDIKAVFWTGVLLAMFVLERAAHFNESDKLIHVKLSGRINLASFLSPQSYGILEYSFERASVLGGDFYLFVLKRLIERSEIRGGLWRMGVVPEEIEHKIDEYLKSSFKEKIALSAEEKENLIGAIGKLAVSSFEQAVFLGNRFIEPKDLFGALSKSGNASVDKLFQLFDIKSGDLENALIFSKFRVPFWQSWRLPSTISGFAYQSRFVKHRVMNRAWSARPTPTLDKFGRDLTDLARTEKIGFLIGHASEYDRMVNVLSRPAKPNVLLVGEPGVGKDALVAHLAFKITRDEVPAELFDKRLVLLDIGALVAGAEQAELQDRVKKIIGEILMAGNVILYIPDAHNLAKTSGKSFLSAADILLPAISGSDFSVIGATYPKEFKQYIEPQSDFVNSFDAIRVEEVTEDEATKILIYESIILERQFKVVVSYKAVKQAVFLARKYFREKPLPSSAEELLKEAFSEAKAREEKALTDDIVIDVAQRRINVPLRGAKEGEAEKLLNLEDLIHERMIDQEEAVKAVSQSLREYRSGLARKGGPIATFLFVGPTGVGKTELSKILAKIQFGSSDAMSRFDMSEYQDRQSIFRFIGSPDGSTSGALTDAVLAKPYGLVLLDEFEKANPDILNLFLQVFDDGRLTDNLGRTADFQNTIIIATSNAHSEFIKTEIEKGRRMKEIGEDLKKKLTEYFKPELINRFSGIIVFKNLSPADTEAIARIQLKDLSDSFKETHKSDLVFSDEAVRKIAELGYDPVFGARPLRGIISDKIRSILAEKVLKNEITQGGTVNVSLEGGELVFNVK